jgi:hypothetical protein
MTTKKAMCPHSQNPCPGQSLDLFIKTHQVLPLSILPVSDFQLWPQYIHFSGFLEGLSLGRGQY